MTQSFETVDIAGNAMTVEYTALTWKDQITFLFDHPDGEETLVLRIDANENRLIFGWTLNDGGAGWIEMGLKPSEVDVLSISSVLSARISRANVKGLLYGRRGKMPRKPRICGRDRPLPVKSYRDTTSAWSGRKAPGRGSWLPTG